MIHSLLVISCAIATIQCKSILMQGLIENNFFKKKRKLHDIYKGYKF